MAVIGAGTMGLCVMRHLASDLGAFEPTCFERQDKIGGLWNYSDVTGTDKYGFPVPYALYNNMM